MPKSKVTFEKSSPRILNVDLKALGILSYDVDNIYPQRINYVVSDSGTAKTSLKIFKKFVVGSGATNTDFGSIKINNKRLTVNKLIIKIAESLGKSDGVALHFNYNGLGQKTGVSFIPFEFARIGLDGTIGENKMAVYDDWDHTKHTKFNKSDISYIDKYDLSKVRQQAFTIEVDPKKEGGSKKTDIEIKAEQLSKYKGQVLYWTPKGSDEYPLAPFDAVVEDMQTEAQTKKFKKNTASKNFLASHILVTGKEENPDTADEFVENLKTFQGGDGSGTMFWMEVENIEDVESIKLIKVDIQDYDGLYEYTETSAKASIRESFLIPPVLVLQAKGGIGTSKEISDASNYYNEITSHDRLIVEEILKEVFDGWSFDINPSDDYSIMALNYNEAIAAEYFPYYTKNEIRGGNGDEPVEELEAETTPLAVTLGVGGTTALAALLADPLLTPEQKKGSLIVLFGLSEQEVDLMLGIEENPINKQVK